MKVTKPAKTEQSALAALKNSGLGDLIARADDLASADNALRRSLPPALAQHCRLVAWDNHRLTFHTASPIWKNKLRLHSQDILSAAHAFGLQARGLHIKIDLGFQPSADDRA